MPPTASPLPRCLPHPPHATDHGDGRLHTAELERVLWRQWEPETAAPSQTLVGIVQALAALPRGIKAELAAELYGIWVGPGGVPDLDEMGHLRGRPLPSGRGHWDDCAGAYLRRTIVLGDRPTSTPDLVLHEVGHALDDLRCPGDRMLSDGPLWAAVYQTCLPYLARPVHRLPTPLGRREFFADAFASVVGGYTVELLNWLGDDRELVLLVAAFYRQQFGFGGR